VCVCASGQWKVKFNEKPKKRLFTKLNGDLVGVPVLYHQKYLATIMHITELKAQVSNSQFNHIFTEPFCHHTFTPMAFTICDVGLKSPHYKRSPCKS